MNKQLIQDIIKAGNKAMDVVHIKYTIDTKDNHYYRKLSSYKFSSKMLNYLM